MNERLLHDFAEIASDWFWETDHQHRFTYFSSRLEAVTGVPSKDFIGKSRVDIRISSLSEEEWQAHISCLKAHEPFRDFIYKANRPADGSEFWVRISGQPVFGSDGDFFGYRGTGTEITNEVLARQALEQSKEALLRQNKKLIAAQGTIERMAYEDELTGLKNRRAMEAALRQLSEGGTETVMALQLDLDHFKRVNDTLGHPAGDEVLRVVGERLKTCCQVSDIGRMGGDEFLILIHETSLGEARVLAQDIIDCVSWPIVIDGKPVHVGTSIGIAGFQTTKQTTQELLNNSDLALYQAKKHGRNQVVVYTHALHQQILSYQKLTNEMQSALDNNELEIWLQPQFDALGEKVTGAEALIRWNHPRLGTIAPREFLPIAEDLDLMPAIDRFVLCSGLDVAKRLADAGCPLPRLSVNLSFGRLNDPSLISDVQSLWTDKRTDLAFELLETVTFDGEASIVLRDTLDQLRKLGVALEVDDFGTGHASITALLQVAPDFVKIDRTLVTNILEEESRAKLVGAMVEMANAIGIGVIAEGVETADQVQCLNKLGCSNLQGYFLARPMPVDAFIDFMLAGQNRITKAS